MTAAEKRDIQWQWYRQNQVRDGHRRGWSFTPLVDYKRPSTPGWQSAPRETEEQAGAWAKVGNVGLRTGKASGIVVIDVDGEPGETTEQIDARADALGLPPTVTVRTGGGGLHFYFKAPDVPVKNSRGVIAPHVDVRSDGGQVVFVGALHASGNAYQFVEGLAPNDIEPADFPLWIIPEPKPYEPPPRLPVARTSGYERCQRYIECLPDAISGSGGHDATFEAACTCFRFGLDEAQVQNLMQDFNATKCQPPWTPRELAHKIQNARDTVNAAGQFGCKLAEDRPPPPSRVVSASAPVSAVEESTGYTLPPFADLSMWSKVEAPEPEWLFTDRIERGIVVGVAAQGGAGKSWLLLQLAYSAATGINMLAPFEPVGPMKVLGFFGEDSGPQVHRRWRRIARVYDYGEESKLFAENCRLLCGWRQSFMADFRNPHPTSAFEAVLAEVQRDPPDLIFVDPKSQFFGLIENDNDQTVMWYSNLCRLIDATNGRASIIVTSHIGKNEKQNGSRGASANFDDARCFFAMNPLSDDDVKKYGVTDRRLYVKLTHEKGNYTQIQPEPWVLKRCTDPGGTGENMKVGGVLVDYDAKAQGEANQLEVITRLAMAVAEAVGKNPEDLSKRQIQRGAGGIVEAVLEKHDKATKPEVLKALDYACEKGFLHVTKGRRGTQATYIPRASNAGGIDEDGEDIPF